MINFKDQLKISTETNNKGDIKLFLSDLAEFDKKNPKLRTFALAKLNPGEEVEFHTHTDECELYYILSGEGVYDDNGKEITLNTGKTMICIVQDGDTFSYSN